MKQRLVLAATLFGVCLLTGCGRTGNVEEDSGNAAADSGISIMENAEDYGYAVNYETVYSGSDSMLLCFCFQDDFLYYVKKPNQAGEQKISYSLCRRGLEEGSREEVLFQKEVSGEDGFTPGACSIYPDGRVVLELSKWENGQTSSILQVLDEDGKEIYTVDITDALYRDYPSDSVFKCVTDADETIYLMSQNQILVYEAGGKRLFSLQAKSGYMETLGTAGDGSVFATQQMMDIGIDVSRINVKERGYSDPCREFEQQIRGQCLAAGGQNTLLLDAQTGLIAFEPGTQRSKQLLKWADLGIDPGGLQGIYMPEPGTVFLLFQNFAEGSYECRLGILTRKLKSEMPTRQVITIGTADGGSQLLENAVAIFNEENSEYLVKIKNYAEEFQGGNSEDPMSDAVQKLRMDILTGNAPDIIDFSQIGLDYEQLLQKGFIEDLYPYIDSSESLSREDLMQPILEAYTMDGKLPCVPRAVYISTLAIKKSLAGDKKSWTPEEYMELAKSQPADVQITAYATNERILYECMGYDIEHYIDQETGECFFDSEEFKRILEFAGCFPDTLPESEEDYSRAELLAEDRRLLSPVVLRQIGDIKEWNADFNGDLTFIGYPFQEGQGGSVFVGLDALGISSQSECKEGAWRFIQSLFTEKIQTDPTAWGIPVLQNIYDHKKEAAMEQYYDVDEEGNQVEVPYEFQAFYDGTYAVTEAEAEQFEDLMQNTRRADNNIFGTGSQINKIIYEEAASYFVGQKSLEEVTDIIQNRVQLYLQENL